MENQEELVDMDEKGNVIDVKKIRRHYLHFVKFCCLSF